MQFDSDGGTSGGRFPRNRLTCPLMYRLNRLKANEIIILARLMFCERRGCLTV